LNPLEPFATVHPDDRAGVTAAFEDLVGRHGAVAPLRLRVQHKGGRWLWLEGACTNLLADPEVRAVVANFHDVTERVQASEELKTARLMAGQASQAKSAFLATLSHEIRTPMNGMAGMASLLLGTRLSEEQREYGEAIQSSTQALGAIVNDALDLSLIEAGKMRLESNAFDLRRILGEVVDLMTPVAREKNLLLHFRCPIESPSLFLGDAGRIRQVALNLVGNALKFTEQGEVGLAVPPPK